MNINIEKKHITFYIRNLSVGGIQRIVIALANCLVGRGHNVDIVLANKGEALSSDVKKNVNVLSLNYDSVSRSVPDFLRYSKIKNPDVVISMDDSINIITPILNKIFGISDKLIVVVQNNMTEYSKVEGVWYSGILPYLIKISYPLADDVVTVSEGVKSDLDEISSSSARDARVIYNPIMDGNIEEKKKQEVSHPWLTDDKYPVIIGVGRFSPQKNFPLLIRAFAEVCETREARLIILGDGQERRRMETVIDDLGLNDRVDLPGFVENPFPYYDQASLFALSSNYEGFPTVIIEALACGCPIVSTRCPSGPDEALDEGKYGELVPVGDRHALAEAMKKILKDPPDPDMLRQRACDFSVETISDQYEEVIYSLV